MPTIGACYTWDDVPGTGRNYVRFLEGQIASAALSPILNPGVPLEPILVGAGPVRERIAEILCQHELPFPVYVKQAVNQWEYQGQFVVDRCTSSSIEIEQHNARSGRNDIVRIIYLRPAG